MTSSEKKLLGFFSVLDDSHKELVIEFVEFMAAKYPDVLSPKESHAVINEPKKLIEPTLIERPESESVIAAIKRLSQGYPMLNKEKLFDKTSMLMTAHIMQGRDVVEVIDEIEMVFKDQYETYVEESVGEKMVEKVGENVDTKK